ncbi:hypothetical protein NIIDMKKI_00140 [Mycobacterium kansasii]|uniref:Methyltransferase small domain-containing protein n=1 Tax=Mycobacterium kansasii TaxID=1768 RepID=A0A7G1I8K5_MYCKA|nr:hypothetical protein NIIDMKKI_00140 [Mycobacterium kansasii]
MTTTYPALDGALVADMVYQPQFDSRLLVDTMRRTGLIPRRRVLDLCTGSGFVAIAAAEMGCASVTAFDICPHAVRCSRDNVADAGVDVDVRQGSWTRAFDCAPFEVIVSNPPYVPAPPVDDSDAISPAAGPSWAWNAGPDGRLVLDPLCKSAAKLLCDGDPCCWCSRLWQACNGLWIFCYPPVWMPKSLPLSGFRSVRCCRRGRHGWRRPGGYPAAVATRNSW